MHSHHSHSGAYCAHASASTSPSSMLEKAFEKGFESYCLSEHVPRSLVTQLYPEELDARLRPSDLAQRFEEYLKEGRRCAQAWEGRMQVLMGAELENIDDECLGYLEEVLEGGEGGQAEKAGGAGAGAGAMVGKGRVDFLVGSLHHVGSIPIDFDLATFQCVLDNFRQEDDGQDEHVARRRAHLRLILCYLEQQYDLIKHFEPEVIGHFDLCRLYQPDTPMTMAGISVDTSREEQTLLLQVQEAVEKNVSLVCQYGGLFEVNSASIRKGWPTPYPASDVLDVILTHGGRLCLSDDAHSHEQVGLNFHKVKQYLETKGVETIWKLEKSKANGSQYNTTSFPRGTVAVPVLDWAKHPFWQGC